jgi:hypothetical protein
MPAKTACVPAGLRGLCADWLKLFYAAIDVASIAEITLSSSGPVSLCAGTGTPRLERAIKQNEHWQGTGSLVF